MKGGNYSRVHVAVCDNMRVYELDPLHSFKINASCLSVSLPHFLSFTSFCLFFPSASQG